MTFAFYVGMQLYVWYFVMCCVDLYEMINAIQIIYTNDLILLMCVVHSNRNWSASLQPTIVSFPEACFHCPEFVCPLPSLSKLHFLIGNFYTICVRCALIMFSKSDDLFAHLTWHGRREGEGMSGIITDYYFLKLIRSDLICWFPCIAHHTNIVYFRTQSLTL